MNGPTRTVASIESLAFANDAFGRRRVSNTGQRIDVEFIYDLQPDLFDAVEAGAGTVVHNAASADATLAVNGESNNDSAALYSYDAPYTAGNSQLVDVTGTLNLSAMPDGRVELFTRSSVAGEVETTTYTVDQWTESQPRNVDWSTSQIVAMDFQSLKVGMQRWFLVRSGVPIPLHEVANDNMRSGGYWNRPSLPLFWRIYNAAPYTYAEMGLGDEGDAMGVRYRVTASGSAKMRAICGTIKSEGGANLFDLPGFPRCADNGVTPKTVSSTLVPLLSIRPAATFNSITNRQLAFPTGFSIGGTNPMRYVLLSRPTLTGPSWTAVNATYSAMEYDVTASAVSGGIAVYSDYFSSNRNSFNAVGGLLGRSLLANRRSGTSDILTIAAVRTGTSDSEALASLLWRELR